MASEPSPCDVQQQLIAQAQEHLLRLGELARAEADAVANRSANLIMEIDREIERVLWEKERALGALYEHRREHGC